MIAWDPPCSAELFTTQSKWHLKLVNGFKAEDDLGLAIVAHYKTGLSPSPPASFMKSTVDLRTFFNSVNTVLYITCLEINYCKKLALQVNEKIGLDKWEHNKSQKTQQV